MAPRKEQHAPAQELVRTKKEWMESAAYLGAERFEVAGALFLETDYQMIAESQVKSKLTKYKGGM